MYGQFFLKTGKKVSSRRALLEICMFSYTCNAGKGQQIFYRLMQKYVKRLITRGN